MEQRYIQKSEIDIYADALSRFRETLEKGDYDERKHAPKEQIEELFDTIYNGFIDELREEAVELKEGEKIEDLKPEEKQYVILHPKHPNKIKIYHFSIEKDYYVMSLEAIGIVVHSFVEAQGLKIVIPILIGSHLIKIIRTRKRMVDKNEIVIILSIRNLRREKRKDNPTDEEIFEEAKRLAKETFNDEELISLEGVKSKLNEWDGKIVERISREDGKIGWKIK